MIRNTILFTAPALAALLALSGGHDLLPPTVATAASPALPAPPASGEMDFVMVKFHPAIFKDKEEIDCPDGKGGVKLAGVLRDNYLDTLTRAEAERLSQPGEETERELNRKWRTWASQKGTNVCSHPTYFPDFPTITTMKGPVAWGLDLDGDSGDGSNPNNPTTCKHASFTTPDGIKGVDNQVWRALGCENNYRGKDPQGGDVVRGFDGFVMSGEWTQVIKLKGVNSLVNDPDVQVIYANTDDRPVVDSGGKPVHYASFVVASKGRKAEYRNVLRGRIVDGVLMTDPKEIALIQTWGQGGAFAGSRMNWTLRHGRMRMAFQPDGSLKGLVGGYQVPIKVDILQSGMLGGAGTVGAAGMNCAGLLNTLTMLADGDKDPKTGRCTTISSAYAAEAVPAFVTDVPPPRKVASR